MKTQQLLIVQLLCAVYASNINREASRHIKNSLRVTEVEERSVTTPNPFNLQTERFTTNGIDQQCPVYEYIESKKLDLPGLASLLDDVHDEKMHPIFQIEANRNKLISMIAKTHPFLLLLAIKDFKNIQDADILGALENLAVEDFEIELFQELFPKLLSKFGDFTSDLQKTVAQGVNGLTRSKVISLLNDGPGTLLEKNIELFLTASKRDGYSTANSHRLDNFPIDAVMRLPSPALEVAMTSADTITFQHIFKKVGDNERVNIIKFFAEMPLYLIDQYFPQGISVNATIIERLSGLDSKIYSRAMFIGSNTMVNAMIMEISEDNLESILEEIVNSAFYYKNTVNNHSHNIELEEESFERLLTDDFAPLLAVLPILGPKTLELLARSVPVNLLEEVLEKTTQHQGESMTKTSGLLSLDEKRAEKISDCKPENLIRALLLLDINTSKTALAGLSMKKLEEAFVKTDITEFNAHYSLLEQRIFLNEKQRGELLKVGVLSANTIRLLHEATRQRILANMESDILLLTLRNLVGESVHQTLTSLIGDLSLNTEAVDAVLGTKDLDLTATMYILSTPEIRNIFNRREAFKSIDIVNSLVLKNSYLIPDMVGLLYLPANIILTLLDSPNIAKKEAYAISFVHRIDFSELLTSVNETQMKRIVDYLDSHCYAVPTKLFPRKFILTNDALQKVLEQGQRTTNVIARYLGTASLEKLLTSCELEVKVAVIEYLVNETFFAKYVEFLAKFLETLKLSESNLIREKLHDITRGKLDDSAHLSVFDYVGGSYMYNGKQVENLLEE